jgi:hypothetical protein
MNPGGDEWSLASLLERSAELKRALVEREAIDAIDRFALQHRLPDGKTVLDQFLDSLLTSSMTWSIACTQPWSRPLSARCPSTDLGCLPRSHPPGL